MKYFFYLLFIFLFLVGCTAEDDAISSEHPTIDSVDSLPNSDIDSITGNNLLLNNGVEEWERDFCEYPSEWLLPHGYCNKVTQNMKVVSEGKYSAKMKALETGVSARVAQLVKITPGCKIRIRFSYYVEQWKTNGARTYCYFRTGSAENTSISISDLREIYTNDEYYIFRGGGYGKAYLPYVANTWLVFDETITVPSNANYFEFGINSYLGTTIYVDNFYVVEVAYGQGTGICPTPSGSGQLWTGDRHLSHTNSKGIIMDGWMDGWTGDRHLSHTNSKGIIMDGWMDGWMDRGQAPVPHQK